MATKKQRKRMQKERRHEYETVWVDSEGNELEEPPETADDDAPAPRRRNDPQKPQRPSRPQRGAGATRAPLPPSWRRAAKRALILGGVIFAFVALTGRTKDGQHEYASALFLAVVSTALFIPYMYGIDRFLRRRWERKQGEQATTKRR